MANNKAAAPHPPRKPIRRINKWRLILSLFLLLGVGSLLVLTAYAAVALPAFNPQQLTGANTTLLYDQDDKMFSSLHGVENRLDVSLDQVPPALIQAFLATEDKDFYKHHGVNFRGIARALLRNFQSGDLTGQGASTITQQLARSSFLTSDKNWERKIKEMFLAFKIEASYSKEEILEMYLNKIYFGAGAYGVQAAAHTYFGKDVSQLTMPESALLAGLVQSPNYYNPFLNLERAKARQKLVLNSMADSGYIGTAESSQAYETPLNLAKVQNKTAKYGFYTDAVIDEAVQILANIKGYEDTDSALYNSGLRIYTSLNPAVQAYAEEYFKKVSNFPAGIKNGPQVQVGMALVDNSSGEIKAVMGGREYEQQRGFNRATSAFRQPGSSIKPLTVYAPALELGNMPFMMLNDAPISYNTSNGVWKPQNYDNQYRGPITMRTAVQYSINTYAVQMLDLLGTRHGFDMGRSLGLSLIDSPGTNDLNLAALALGGLTKGVTPVQMAAAYASLGNTGVYNKPHFINKIENNNGLTIYEFKQDSQRVMMPQTAWLMNSMLQTVVSSGTGTKAKVANVPTAGKTGTSEELTDIWFCGVTPKYSAAIWMGYDDQKYKMVNAAGGGAPALMFKAVVGKAHQGVKAGSWTMPSDIVSVSVCSLSGQLPGPSCPEITEYCLKSLTPTTTCTSQHNIMICKESGKLATKYCRETVAFSNVKTGEDSEATQIPTESCPIHTAPGSIGLSKNTVKICTDPRNDGRLYRANLAAPSQSGGCPDKYVYEIVLRPGEQLPSCPLDNHKLKK